MRGRRIGQRLGALVLLAAANHVRASDTPQVAWGDCPEAWTGTSSGTLGARLQCATMTAPLDHAAPDGRTFSVGVIRVRAAKPALREGAIFFNKGGPGAHPGRLLRSMGEGWSAIDPEDPDEGDKRRLAERFDLVAVIPRGLPGSTPVQCVTGLPPRFRFLPGDLGDTNWRKVVDEAQSMVDACTALPEARYINTEQHVHDMDLARRMLGDERLHFYGISYGGRVGAWYASVYPAHAGRLLLDSSMDFTHDYQAALRMAMAARQRAFNDNAVQPLLREPARHGLGDDANTVALAIDNLPGRLREAWAGQLDTAARLAAALRLKDWLRHDPPSDLTAMSRLIRQARFSAEPALDLRIRWDAVQLAGAYYAAPQTEPQFALGPEGDSVRSIVACNDSAWPRSEDEIRETAGRDGGRYLHYTGLEALEELSCTRWGGPRAREPQWSLLDQAQPFLLIQSENDTATPLDGASFIVDRHANARMLLVRHSDVHGVFNFTTSGCIERTVARYLLTGELPVSRSRVFACDEAVDPPAGAIPGRHAHRRHIPCR